MKFFTLYSAKYKKQVSNLRREDAIFHSTFISHTQIGGKLENNLNKHLKKRTVHVLRQTTVPTSHHWRRLQHTFRCFRTKTRHVAGKMNALGKGHVAFRMLSIKKRLLSRLFCTKYWIACRDVRYYNNIKRSGKYSSDFVQNFAGKKRVSLCSANAWIGTHVTFPVIPKRCCRFSVVQSFQFEFATHLTYIQGNIRDQLIENTTVVSVDVILSV